MARVSGRGGWKLCLALIAAATVLACSGGDDDTGSGGTGNTNGSGGSTSGGTIPGCTPNLDCQLDPPDSTGDVQQDCVNRINQFRTECACVQPLQRWTAGEACADQQAEYDSTRTAHAGFRDRICESGSAQNECPGWPPQFDIVAECLQQMWEEGPPPSSSCEGQCFQDHGHFINMSNTEYSKVACGFFTAPNGEIWSVQNFSR